MQMLLDGRHHILERMQQYQEEIAKKKYGLPTFLDIANDCTII